MILSKYATAIVQIALVAASGLAAIAPGAYTPDVIGQLLVQVLGAVVVFLVPLLNSKWAGAVKTGAAVATAVIVAVIPIVLTGTFTFQNGVVVFFAALTAFATEVGVQVRTDAKKARHLATSDIAIPTP